MSTLMLGIDLGTTGLKTALVAGDGRVIAEAGREYPLHYPQPNWAEQEPEDWWQAFVATVQEVFSRNDQPGVPLAGICISSQAPVIVPMDAQGKPLMRGMIWADKRAEAECDVLRSTIGEDRIRQITANSVSSFLAAPTYVWLKRYRPDVFEKTNCFLMANSYINFRLTGRYSMDVSQSLLQLLVDAATCDWSPEIMGALDLPVGKFPPIRPCTDIIGQVRPDVAGELGIPAGTPVLAGTTDTTAAMLGMGVVHSGEAFISQGTGSNIGLCVTEPRPNRHLICIPHAIPGRWMLSAVMTSTGASMKWFVNQLSAMEKDFATENGRDPYAFATQPAVASAPGSGGVLFLPYLMGEQAPIWDPDSRGVFIGLSANTTRGDMVRAIMEGIALGIRQNFQVFTDDGWSVGDVRIQGGAARNPLWNQIIADTTGHMVLVPPSASGAPIGDALLVGIATGVFSSVEEAVSLCPPPKETHVPDPINTAIYDRLYAIYTGLYPTLKATFRDMAEFRQAVS